MSAPRVFIGMPTAGNTIQSDCTASLMDMTARLHGRGVGTVFRVIDGPNAMIQRDLLAREFLAGDCTHLLCIDNDMAFPADICDRLLAAGKRLIGAVYPRRSLDLRRLATLRERHGFDDALALAHDWNVHLLDGTVTVRDGLARVGALATGFLLIERACLVEMMERIDVPSYTTVGGPANLRAFFRELNENGAVWSHDYAFCKRWIEAGGEVWADVQAEILHVGAFRYGMPFANYLGALARTGRASYAPA